MLILIDRSEFNMYNVTITMSNGKVFEFVTDNNSKEHEYLYCHENNQPYWIPVGDDGIYVNPMHIVYVEFNKLTN